MRLVNNKITWWKVWRESFTSNWWRWQKHQPCKQNSKDSRQFQFWFPPSRAGARCSRDWWRLEPGLRQSPGCLGHNRHGRPFKCADTWWSTRQVYKQLVFSKVKQDWMVECVTVTFLRKTFHGMSSMLWENGLRCPKYINFIRGKTYSQKL